MEEVKNNFFLTGMMGSWKSTVGKKLSKKLKMNFLDTDDELEKIYNKTIREIFNQNGETYFRKIEKDYFKEKSNLNNYIISTGGGIVINADNRNILQSKGITFLLYASINILNDRINNINSRPLLNDNKFQKLKKIWDDRKEFYYSSADFVIDTSKMDSDQVTNEMLKIIKREYGKS